MTDPHARGTYQPGRAEVRDPSVSPDDVGVRHTLPLPIRGLRYLIPGRRRGFFGAAFGLVAGLGLLLILFIVLALGAHALGWLPHLSNPFAEQNKQRTEAPVLLSIQDLNRFEAASGNFQVIVDSQTDRRLVPDIIFNHRTLFVAVGSVDTFVDFTQIGSGDITVSPDRQTVTVNLPAPQMEKPNIDHSKSYVFAEQLGFLNRIAQLFGNNPNSENKLYQAAEQKITSAAVASGLTQRAEQNTRLMLQGMLRALGFTAITINFAPSP